MRIKFREAKLSKSNKMRLEEINNIIEEYQSNGYILTLRQLYYQLVIRNSIENKKSEYSKLSKLLKEGRMSGIVDWDAIEDRLRQPYIPSAFESPKQILDAAISQYESPRMAGQKTYIEVWVEKDALSGVLKKVTSKYHIPILVNRGYSSVSAMFDSYMRFVNDGAYEGRAVKVLYLGDFDPSGLDMIRDIKRRIEEFQYGHNDGYLVDEMKFCIESLALTEHQINEYNPPPNPTKIKDPRAKDYIKKYGRDCWEVDALKPEVLHELLEDEIKENINMALYKRILQNEKTDKLKLEKLKEYIK